MENQLRLVSYINNGILNELREKYGDIIPYDVQTAYGAMSYIREATSNRFVVIIDEFTMLSAGELANNNCNRI